MSNNKSTVKDNSGKNEDWIELYNSSNFPISTNNLYLSDTISNLLKWKLPNSVVLPDDYLIVWADEDGNQGSNHANFKLSNLGEIVILSNLIVLLLILFLFLLKMKIYLLVEVQMVMEISLCLHQHLKVIMILPMLSIVLIEIISKPSNPFNEKLIVKTSFNFSVKDILGKLVLRNKKYNNKYQNWKSGTYFIHLEDNSVHKIIKL